MFPKVERLAWIDPKAIVIGPFKRWGFSFDGIHGFLHIFIVTAAIGPEAT